MYYHQTMSVMLSTYHVKCVCVYVLVMDQLPYDEVNSAISHDPVAAAREPIVAQHYMAPNTGLQATSQEFSELVYATNLKRTL